MFASNLCYFFKKINYIWALPVIIQNTGTNSEYWDN